MYPDRIKRAILDGVADSHDYMAGGWSTNLRDTDLIFTKMTEYCFEGGAEHCPIWDKDGPAVISEKVKKAFTSLRHNPISVPGNSTNGPQIVTYNDLKRLIREIVYNPLRDLPLTTKVLHETLQGEGTTLAAWKAEQHPAIGEQVSEQCKQDGPYSPSCFESKHSPTIQWEATYGIACSDAISRLHESKEDFKKYADKISAQSGLLGAAWASIMLPCTAWHARPHWRYDGNFNNKTAHPIVFLGNTFDPVTPLYNAFVIAKGFDGAGILHQDSEGHCFYASPSMCTGRTVREYFQTGKLPGEKGGLENWEAHGKLCKADILPLSGYGKDSTPALPEGESDQAMWEALVALNQVWP